MFKSVLQQIFILAFGSMAMLTLVLLGAGSQNQLGDERELDAQVRIPRPRGSLCDIPSSTSLYCAVVFLFPASSGDTVLARLKRSQGEN
jgi:hypothetical protein